MEQVILKSRQRGRVRGFLRPFCVDEGKIKQTIFSQWHEQTLGHALPLPFLLLSAPRTANKQKPGPVLCGAVQRAEEFSFGGGDAR